MPKESEHIEALGLSGRLNNALRRMGITQVDHLSSVTQVALLHTKNLGKKSATA